MAKASKSDSAAKPAAKTTRKKAPAKATKSTASRAAKAPAPAAAPMIDTNRAAESAARMLLARAAAGGHAPATTAHAESSTFKHLKEQLAKPKAALNSLLQSTGNPSTQPGSHLPHQQGPVGRARTHGADVTRTGVPRRTSG